MDKRNEMLRTRNRMAVKQIIKKTKEKGLIKPLKEAFKENPVKEECHKGNCKYYLD